MQFPCPSCAAPISAKPPKPGRYTPKCPKCGGLFTMTVQVGPISAASRPAPPKPIADIDTTQPSLAPEPAAPADEQSFITKPTQSESSFDPDSTSATGAGQQSADFDPDATSATGGNLVQPPGFDQTAANGEQQSVPDATGEFETSVRPSASPRKAIPRTAETPDEAPAELGGYEVRKRLGKGGMGSVYLARQVSLDREVALKVMNPEFATDPIFLARFIREAYAAAQLTHHNVVQIYDIGEDDGKTFFSMELVNGRSLGELLRERQKLPAAEAVTYILQAAGGLRFAHDRGMVHRDIKPDNLMVNSEGIVKVADLGLVKTRAMGRADDATPTNSLVGGSMLRELANVTRVGSAMGSPSYMAPEQCRDASSVDARADIYSLGCSLYALLAGRAPFSGTTAVEVISKHLTEPPPPIRKVANTVPVDLAAIVDKTLRKDPVERYQSMDELIAAFKDWQAKQSGGPPRPTPEQLAQFEGQIQKLRKGSSARTIATYGPILGVILGVVALVFSPLAGGAVLLGTFAAAVSGVISSALFTGSYLFRKARQWALGTRFADWLTVGFATVLAVVGLYFAGLLGVGIGAMIGGAALGVGYGLFLAKPAQDRLEQIREEMEGVLKRVRLLGLDEQSVREFAIDAAGSRWEEVYELLYGYPAKLLARTEYAEKVAGKPKFAAWRDGLIQRLENAIDTRRQAKARKLLQAVETERLKAEGLSAAEAKVQAASAAEDLVEQGVEIRAANTNKAKKIDLRAVLTRYEKAKLGQQSRPRVNPLGRLLRKVFAIPFDPRLRLVLGAVLIVAGLMWIRQNTPAGAATPSGFSKFLPLLETPEKCKPLTVSVLPPDTTSWVNSANVLLAGLLAVFSLFVGRTLGLLFLALGVGVAVVGYQLGLPIPEVGPLKPVHVCGIAGFVLGLFGLIFFRRSS